MKILLMLLLFITLVSCNFERPLCTAEVIGIDLVFGQNIIKFNCNDKICISTVIDIDIFGRNIRKVQCDDGTEYVITPK